MRPRRKVLIILVFAAAVAITLAYCFGAKSEPHIEIGVLRYIDKSVGQFPAAVVVVSNSGPVAVIYYHLDSAEPVILRTESLAGSVSEVVYVGGDGDGLVMPTVLSRGSNIEFRVRIPEGTLRWQLRYTVRSASAQSWAFNEFTSLESRWGWWGHRLYGVVGNFLPDDDGSPQQFWSEVFEVPAQK